MSKKPDTKSRKDNSHKLERTAANKKRRAERLKRKVAAIANRTGVRGNTLGEAWKTTKNRARKARQLAMAKKMGCTTYREWQKKRAYLASFDSSVEVVKTVRTVQDAVEAAIHAPGNTRINIEKVA